MICDIVFDGLRGGGVVCCYARATAHRVRRRLFANSRNVDYHSLLTPFPPIQSRCAPIQHRTPEGLYEGDEEVTLRLPLAELMARCVEIEPLIVVLLTVWCAGAPTVKANGRSRLKQN